MIKGRYVIKSNDKVVYEKDNLITTNGFAAINKYLARASMDWAGSIVVGGFTTAAAITDKTLYYETARVPVTLKSYAKFNPKYVVTNKQLSASINLASASGSGTVVTYTTSGAVAHNFVAGQTVVITGFTGITAYNGTYTIASTPTTSTFTVSSTTTGTSTGTGTAAVNTAILQFQSITPPTIGNGYSIQVTGVDATFNGTYTINASSYSVITQPTVSTPGTYQIMYPKSASSVPSTVVSSTSALITVLTDSTSANVYNNEIVLKGTLNPATALYINEVGSIPLSVSGGAFRDYSDISNFSEISLTDTSKSQWKISAANVSLAGTTTIQGSSANPIGYIWNSGSNTATFNVSSTLGMKAGNSVFISGVTPAGAYSAPSGTYTVNQINGNYQVILNMGSTAASNQGGYGGTMSINSTTAAQPSYTGLFNILLPGGSTATLSGLAISSSNYTNLDSLMLLYYANGAISSQTLTVSFTDSLNATYNMTTSITVAGAGWNIATIPLTNFTSSSQIINSISIGIAGATSIFLDGLRFVSSSYLSAHPLSSGTSVTLPSEYQLSSRSVFSSPVIKTPGQQMDIEYHIQVT